MKTQVKSEVSRRFRVIAERLTYHRLWTKEESALGGWKYTRAVLGTFETTAESLTDCDRETRKRFPKATHSTNYEDCGNGFEILCTGNL